MNKLIPPLILLAFTAMLAAYGFYYAESIEQTADEGLEHDNRSAKSWGRRLNYWATGVDPQDRFGGTYYTPSVPRGRTSGRTRGNYYGTSAPRGRPGRPYYGTSALDGWYSTSARRDIVDEAVSSGLTGLVNLVKLAGLEDTLRGNGPFTVFAPTDEAFEKLTREKPDQVKAMKADPVLLKNVLLGHVLSGKILRTFGNEWRGGGPYQTAATNTTSVKTRRYRAKPMGPLTAYVNASKVILSNVVASNGIVHVIDTVLIA